MALSVPEAVHSELQALGVQLSDPVDKFWDVFGGRLKEHNRSTCKAIAEDLQEEFACISVGSMRNPDLTAHDFEKLIVKHGGKKGWLRSIEHLLDFTFRRAATSAPESAALVETKQSGPMREKPTGFVGYKVGAHLKRHNELGRLQPPRHVMTRGVEETNDWKNNPLSYNDHKAVCNDIFWWVVLNFKSVKKCILMFRELGKHLNTEFPKTSQKIWMTKLHNRWKNGLRTSAKVIAALAPTTFELQSETLCPSHTAHPPPCRVPFSSDDVQNVESIARRYPGRDHSARGRRLSRADRRELPAEVPHFRTG